MRAILSSILVVAIILLFCNVFADEVDSLKESTPPDIQFKEKIFDFGEVYKGEKITHIYKFTNAGQGVLNVEKVRSSCGCTAVNITSTEIEPGGTGEIKVTFYSRSYDGWITKQVFIHSNDPDEPITTLKITAMVKIDLVVNPIRLDFGLIDEGESDFRKLTVLPVALERLEIEKLEILSEYVTLESVKYSEGDKKGFEVIVTLSSRTPQGRILDTLRIYTNSKIQPIIQVPIIGLVLGKVEFSPEVYDFEVNKGDSVIFEVSLDVGAKRGYNIIGAKDKLGYFTSEFLLLGLKGGKKVYRIILRPTTDAPEGSFEEDLELYTNFEKQPIMKIRLKGIIY